MTKFFLKGDYTNTRVSIVPGLFQYSSPGTFQSQDLQDLGPLVPGRPGTKLLSFFAYSCIFFSLLFPFQLFSQVGMVSKGLQIKLIIICLVFRKLANAVQMVKQEQGLLYNQTKLQKCANTCISDKKKRGKKRAGKSQNLQNKSRDFLVPGPSGSLDPVPSWDLPGTSRNKTVLLESLVYCEAN